MSEPTPLVELEPGLYLKLEYVHASGSIKHRSIPRFLEELHDSGELAPGARIAIRSAGAAAVTTAWAGARVGHPVIAVLPPSASPTTVALIRWLGAECALLPAGEATALVEGWRSNPGTYLFAQSEEPRLIDHYRPIAREIVAALGEGVTVTIGIGTGLSATGVALELHERAPRARLFGVEPAEARVAAGCPWAPHDIPGLAPPIAQPLLRKDLLAGIIPVASRDARSVARDAARRAGWMIGPSSGAALAAALELRARGQAGPLVAICACSAVEYLSPHVP